MILQCLTKGIKSEALHKEILYIEDCDLDKARRVCFTFESAQRSNTVVADKSDHSSVGAVGYSGRTFSAKKGSSGTTTGPSKQRPCGICKSSEHWANKCPEKKKLKCTICGKKDTLRITVGTGFRLWKPINLKTARNPKSPYD